MSEKRVRIGKEFEHVPAVKSGRGWLGLEKGKFATVSFDRPRGKLVLREKIEGKMVRRFFPVEEYAKANEEARKANAIGAQAGASFGSLRKEEERALKIWREYVERATLAGTPPRKLDEIMRELVEREQTKDETPLFKDVAFQFLEMKEREKTCKLRQRERLKSVLRKLTKKLGNLKLAEITETKFLETLSKTVKSRDGNAPAPKTLNHWIEFVKEMFKWWFIHENKNRRPNEKLNNPLELLAKKKIIQTDEPAIISAQTARALLCDLLENEPASVPATAVQMFCGVRNACAIRLRWRDIRNGEIILARSITKTNETRSVPVSENLREWLDACKLAGVPCVPDSLIFAGKDTPKSELAEMSDEARERVENLDFSSRANAFSKAMRRATKRTGITKPANSFRHTAVSCLAKLYGFEKASDWCGHDIQTQGKFYRSAVSEQEAKDYFNIYPPRVDTKTIPFSRDGTTKPPQIGDGAPALDNSIETTPATRSRAS